MPDLVLHEEKVLRADLTAGKPVPSVKAGEIPFIVMSRKQKPTIPYESSGRKQAHWISRVAFQETAQIMPVLLSMPAVLAIYSKENSFIGEVGVFPKIAQLF
ncbi:MAG TPA: hypothetical protein VJQ55_00440 [Candidatus Binatia bacterium]|nr:hypothetical protein [Candidatus Binatia bacterium]